MPPCPSHENGTRKVPVVKGDMPAPKPPDPPPQVDAARKAAVEDFPPMPGVIARPEPPRAPDPPPKPDPQTQKKAAPPKGKALVPPKKSEPILEGLLGRRVTPPDPRAVAFALGVELDDGAFVIHPHGPDEPCRRRG